MEVQKLKSRVSAFRDCPFTMHLDGLGLCFSFGRQCCLCAELYSLKVASIMESAVLRSGAVFQLPVTSTKQLVLYSCFLCLVVISFL